jgi:hypothetical protein
MVNTSLPRLTLTGAKQQAVLHVATICVSSKVLGSGLDILAFELFLQITEIKPDGNFINTPFVIVSTALLSFLSMHWFHNNIINRRKLKTRVSSIWVEILPRSDDDNNQS